MATCTWWLDWHVVGRGNLLVSHGCASKMIWCRAESEHRKLTSEAAVAKKEAELAQARIVDLTAQLESSCARMTELQGVASAERAHLTARHRDEVEQLQGVHQRVVADMQAMHDRTHSQIAAALADNGALHARVREAEDDAEKRTQDLIQAERSLQAREADLEVCPFQVILTKCVHLLWRMPCSSVMWLPQYD